jgi:glycosyltransferase involved in cell wall biosynthesis
MWRRNLEKLKILFLSSTHERGHGVPVVLNLQVAHLVARGHDIFVGGPKGENEAPYDGCQRVFLTDPAEAASFAVQQGIDCVVVETPPFFSVVRWLGEWPRTLFIDHGEPPAEFFPDGDARHQVAAEKRLCFAMSSRVTAISAAVRAEGSEERAQIIPNGNSHLVVWHDGLLRQRRVVRDKFGWADKVVVLNVCRFHAAERRYKGLDRYAEVMQEFQFMRPKLAGRTLFVLCGRAETHDVAEMERYGFEVYSNITDIEMTEMYLAADIYVNFSLWEGYNLGVGQALAAGLPVIASDIPAHRAFSIFTSNSSLTIIEKLSEYVEAMIDDNFSAERKPTVTAWGPSLERLEREIVELCK